MRLPSTVFLAGILAVPLTYWLARRLDMEEGRARVAAAMLAFSPGAMIYGVASADAAVSHPASRPMMTPWVMPARSISCKNSSIDFSRAERDSRRSRPRRRPRRSPAGSTRGRRGGRDRRAVPSPGRDRSPPRPRRRASGRPGRPGGGRVRADRGTSPDQLRQSSRVGKPKSGSGPIFGRIALVRS